MKSFETDLQKYAEKVRLRALERRELRERVLSYMEYHPLPKKAESIPAESIHSPYFFILPFNSLPVRIAAGVLASIVFIIIPFVAEQSVPGDVLYAVKTGVNEEIQSQFANSPYEKVVFETKLMERRISEARLLAEEGKLTKEVSAELAETVKIHADAAQNGIAELRTNNAEEAAIAQVTLGSALEVQSAVLDTGSTEESQAAVAEIIDVVNTARERVAENQDPTAPSYDGLSARIELETTRAYELLEVVKKIATQEEQGDMTRRLADIDRLILEAENTRTTDESAAVSELMGALGLVQKLIVFMTDIDVRESVALETLVPIIPTIEERAASAKMNLDSLIATSTLITGRLALLEGVEIAEKVLLGMTELSVLINSATTSFAANDIDGAEATIAQAMALAHDLDLLTQTAPLSESQLPNDIPADVETPGTTTEAVPEEEVNSAMLPTEEIQGATNKNVLLTIPAAS